MEESEDGWTGTGKVSMEYDGDGHMAWFNDGDGLYDDVRTSSNGMV